jgi:hypothetical protein
MSEPGGGEDRGFTVVDRRASATGEESAQPASEPRAAGADAPPGLSGFDFSMLVQSFALTALHHLGLAPPEPGGSAEKNLPLARQNIEILEILELKTRGNLEAGEAKLLSTLLYEVRMHFVEASKPRE